jgi:hypothetical protein
VVMYGLLSIAYSITLSGGTKEGIEGT